MARKLNSPRGRNPKPPSTTPHVDRYGELAEKGSKKKPPTDKADSEQQSDDEDA